MNVAGQNKCCRIASRKISLFGKMQRGKSPSFELFQLDMYASSKASCKWRDAIGAYLDVRASLFTFAGRI